ncbi:hypothetical protein GCM10027082_47350 [Comamonas humi]
MIKASFPADTRVSLPPGGFILWLELPRRFDSRALFNVALEHGICFAPGHVFSASRRLSAGSAWSDRIKDGIRRPGQFARAARALKPCALRDAAMPAPALATHREFPRDDAPARPYS